MMDSDSTSPEMSICQPFSIPSGATCDGQKARSAELLIELGIMYRFQGGKENAEAHFRSALDLATRTKDDKASARALCGLGSVYCDTYSSREAEILYEQAMEISSRMGDDPGTADALSGLGAIYCARSRYKRRRRLSGPLTRSTPVSGTTWVLQTRWEIWGTPIACSRGTKRRRRVSAPLTRSTLASATTRVLQTRYFA